jgi:hypothetical protein
LVGVEVGVEVGALVGVSVGALVGALVGEAVGALVGVSVGLAVGFAVGLGVGTTRQAVSPMMPSVHVPDKHSWHSWYFTRSWYLPDGQWKQLVWPVQAAYLPTPQSMQSSAPP